MTAAAVEPTEKAEIPFNKQPRDWRKAGVIVAFSAIPVALLVIFTYWPFGSMIGYSFYKMKYIGPRQFVGLQNYIDVFTRPDTLSSLKLSLYYMVGALIQVALALLEKKRSFGEVIERSEERRVGKECASMCRSRWSPYH